MNNQPKVISIDTTNFHGHPDYLTLTVDELELHSMKNRDYARVGDPLGNFHRVSASMTALGFPISPTMVALLYAHKQLDAAIQMIVHGYEGEVEGVDKRLRDAHVYPKIARILYKEEQQERKDRRSVDMFLKEREQDAKSSKQEEG